MLKSLNYKRGVNSMVAIESTIEFYGEYHRGSMSMEKKSCKYDRLAHRHGLGTAIRLCLPSASDWATMLKDTLPALWTHNS